MLYTNTYKAHEIGEKNVYDLYEGTTVYVHLQYMYSMFTKCIY